MSIIFDYPGKTLKAISKFLFYVCLVLAVILFLMGGIKVLSAVDEDGYPSFSEVIAYTVEDYAYGISKGYDWYVDGYMGKQQCKLSFWVALSSFCSMPLYALGCLVEDVAEIKVSLKENTVKKEDDELPPL